jgi:hypothetical protein
MMDLLQLMLVNGPSLTCTISWPISLKRPVCSVSLNNIDSTKVFLIYFSLDIGSNVVAAPAAAQRALANGHTICVQ